MTDIDALLARLEKWRGRAHTVQESNGLIRCADCQEAAAALRELSRDAAALRKLLRDTQQRTYQGIPDGWIDHGPECLLGVGDKNCTCGLGEWIKARDAALSQLAPSGDVQP